jgi:hypothetical protein
VCVLIIGEYDKYALALLKRIQDDSSSTSIVLITHRTNEMIRPMMALMEKMIPRNHTTYMFLGEHTENTAGKILHGYDSNILNENNTNSDFSTSTNTAFSQEKINYNLVNTDSSKITDLKNKEILDSGSVIVGDARSFHLSHFYPVLPRDYVVSSKKTVKKLFTENTINGNINKERNTKNKNNYIDNSRDVNDSSKSDKFLDKNGNNSSNNNDNNSSNNDEDKIKSNNKNTQNNENSSKELKTTEININSNNYNNNNNNVNNNNNDKNSLRNDQINDEYIDELYHPYFVMQGNFGGKHSHRKDPKGILNCLRMIEGKLKIEKEQIKEKSREKEKEKEKEEIKEVLIEQIKEREDKDKEKQNRKLPKFVKSSKMNQNDKYTEIISGNIRREIATEKKLLSTVTNNTLTHTIISEITSIQQTQHHTLSTQNAQNEKEKEKKEKKTFQKKKNSNSNFILKNADFSPQNSALNSISIDLVGHLNGEVNIGHLRTGKVRFLSDLNSREYYEAISRVSICLFLFSYYFSILTLFYFMLFNFFCLEKVSFLFIYFYFKFLFFLFLFLFLLSTLF